MADDIIANIAGDQAILVQTETIAVSCLPRTKVTAQCKTNLDGTGLRVTNLGETDTPFGHGQKFQRMRFCNSQAVSDDQCDTDYRINFGEGTVSVVSPRLVTGMCIHAQYVPCHSSGRTSPARAAP